MFLLSYEKSSSILFRHLRQHSQQHLRPISAPRREHIPAQAGWGAWALLSPSLGSAPPWDTQHQTAPEPHSHNSRATAKITAWTYPSVGTWKKAQYLCLSALYELVSSSKSLPFISISVFSTLYTSATMVLKQKWHSH